MTPVVSVLMTAYNRSAYVGEAIESVLASTFTDFELIVVDDCSTDDTFAKAKAYESTDQRVRVHRNERNLGDYPNRNRAASHATGTYLKYLDSDDVIYPHGLAVMVAAMQQYPEAALGTSQLDQRRRPFPILLTPEEAYEEEFFGGVGVARFGPSGSIYRRDRFLALEGFVEARHDGDLLTTLKFARSESIVLLASGLFWWREHAAQEYRHRPHHFTSYNVRKEALAHPDVPLSRERTTQARERLDRAYGRELLSHLLRRGDVRVVTRLLRESRLPLTTLVRAAISGQA